MFLFHEQLKTSQGCVKQGEGVFLDLSLVVDTGFELVKILIWEWIRDWIRSQEEVEPA